MLRLLKTRISILAWIVFCEKSVTDGEMHECFWRGCEFWHQVLNRFTETKSVRKVVHKACCTYEKPRHYSVKMLTLSFFFFKRYEKPENLVRKVVCRKFFFHVMYKEACMVLLTGKVTRGPSLASRRRRSRRTFCPELLSNFQSALPQRSSDS